MVAQTALVCFHILKSSHCLSAMLIWYVERWDGTGLFFSPCPCVIRNRYPTLLDVRITPNQLAVKWDSFFFCYCFLTSGGQRNNWTVKGACCQSSYVHCMVFGSDLYISFFPTQVGMLTERLCLTKPPWKGSGLMKNGTLSPSLFSPEGLHLLWTECKQMCIDRGETTG